MPPIFSQHSTEFSKTVLSCIGDGVLSVDHLGNVTYLNPVAERLTGWTSADAEGQPVEAVFNIVNESTRKTVLNPVREAIANQRPVELANHTILIDRHGNETPIDDSAAPILTQLGSGTVEAALDQATETQSDSRQSVVGAVLIFRSIADRRETERQVQSALDYAGDIVETVRESMLVLDEDLKIISANRSFYKRFGVDPHTTVGRPLFELGDGDWDDSELRRLLKEIIPKSESFDGFVVEREFATLGYRRMLLNARKVFRETNNSTLILLAIEDDTERYELEKAKLRIQNEYRYMVEQVSDYAVFMFDKNGIATSWNEGVAAVLGYQENEFIGNNVGPMIFTDEALSQGVFQWEMNTATDRGVANDDRFMKRKDDSHFWASGLTTAVLDENQELHGFTKILRDRTQWKESSDSIKRLNAELSEADARKTEFISMMAHELRNPLSPIAAAIELMKDGTESEEEKKVLWEIISSQTKQMMRLVDDLLDISRISHGKVEVKKTYIDLTQCARHAIEAVRPAVAESRHSLEVILPDEQVIVSGDATRLTQVFNNLLNNAIKYTELGGNLDFRMVVDVNEVSVRVTDDGIGIDEESLKNVFDLFMQVDANHLSRRAGLGIGLALVKQLVELHRGTIAIDSPGIGHGTIATVRLPLLTNPAEIGLSEDSEQEDEAIEVQPCEVLVVDDLRAITVTVGRLLEKMGHRVRTASSGAEALILIGESVPQIVFSDISMPEMTGYELARHIRDTVGEEITLVAMTGFGMQADRERALSTGFDHHMVKPPDARVLRRLFATL